MDASKLQNEEPITQIDWQQVILNGGPPCFFVEGPQYCGRAERWPGHGNEAFHNYVSLDDLLATGRKEVEVNIREIIDGVNPRLSYGSANGSIMKKRILDAVDTFIGTKPALTEK